MIGFIDLNVDVNITSAHFPSLLLRFCTVLNVYKCKAG